MCEFLERMRLTGTPTEEVRKWSGMTHRVVELTGPFPTPDEMRVELWLHEESATRLLDMCDWIDAEFHKVQAENAKLRELAQRMHRYMADAVEHCGYGVQTTGYTMLGSRVKECEEAMRELGIEVTENE